MIAIAVAIAIAIAAVAAAVVVHRAPPLVAQDPHEARRSAAAVDVHALGAVLAGDEEQIRAGDQVHRRPRQQRPPPLILVLVTVVVSSVLFISFSCRSLLQAGRRCARRDALPV
ncbi:hypothetical protein GGR56DRAFT_638299 [Xylariaceae sp. FL0804]|nr:hypothetical protein GGR56DRAFT_638299 [Xylariaceae sp. FL0804]